MVKNRRIWAKVSGKLIHEEARCVVSLSVPSGWFGCNDTPQVNVHSTEAGSECTDSVPNTLWLSSMSFCWKPL